LNLVGVIHSENFQWKLSGGRVGFPYGAQADFGVKLSEKERSFSALCAGIGMIVYDPIVKKIGFGNDYKYFVINYIYSYYGFYLNFGLSVGKGVSDKITYLGLGQLGYAYQFR